ncbi:MAG: Crp/Fnr family transcriptional regulator [Actinomycetota bacterium]|nr:Crp/Fnr family transcriptional regulator [Actinomycetota bacterium]MDH5225570.1 Crp/Fnr family transcriptional regulator [Actinomycetota bacterium]MDH5313753.1 Crp/Fnr family transcriptional regulator [Actinomycetota bacterium]
MIARELRTPEPGPPETVVRAGAVVVRQGEPCPPMRVVQRGAFVVEALRHDGRRLVLDVLGPGDGIGGPAAGARDHEARMAQATVRALRPGRLREALPVEEAPLLARRAERAARLAADLAWFDVTTRLLARLHVLASRFGRPVAGGVIIGLRLTHDDLADLCGTSRESVTRSMGVLSRDGRIDVPGRGRIVVRQRFSALPSCNRMRLHEPQ